MSKENVGRFFALIQGDEEFKKKYECISNKYEGKELTEKERDKIILEEIIPLAKSAGLDFTLDEFHGVVKPVKKELTDEELDKAVGGRGRIIIERVVMGFHIPEIWECDAVPDDKTLENYFKYSGCPYYTRPFWCPPSAYPGCYDCDHFRCKGHL